MSTSPTAKVSIPIKPPSEDFINLILQLEGTKRAGYIPRNNSGQIIGRSGVTIGKGLDLGQQSVASLRAMGLSEPIITRFAPYLGLQRDKAEAMLKSAALNITEEEEKDINAKVVNKYWQNFHKDFKRKIGYSATELPEKAQYAAASRYFNNGGGIFKLKSGKDTNFLKQLRDRDFDAAGDNLMAWDNTPSLQRRYKIEGKLWKEAFADVKKKSKELKHLQDLKIASPSMAMVMESPLKIVSRLTPETV